MAEILLSPIDLLGVEIPLFTTGFIPYHPCMYGIFTYICLICMVNVGKYTVHGCYGICFIYIPQALLFSHQHFWSIMDAELISIYVGMLKKTRWMWIMAHPKGPRRRRRLYMMEVTTLGCEQCETHGWFFLIQGFLYFMVYEIIQPHNWVVFHPDIHPDQPTWDPLFFAQMLGSLWSLLSLRK